ncbi:unnamed protein product [Heligmosomoides polygyrus]|uniref:Uncharacterized protein n=1 Tax=Heligmosomoides polygyrus TaxID=6339 RepID=A0A183F2F9_HELPZ|nr:unnamed protein product [Heligmosomoides polygyrus]
MFHTGLLAKVVELMTYDIRSRLQAFVQLRCGGSRHISLHFVAAAPACAHKQRDNAQREDDEKDAPSKS